MKKKKTIFTYIKRTLLIIILFVVVTCLSVFFLGKYKASSTEFENEFSDSFWDSLDGFKHIDEQKADIERKINEADINNPNYILPYDEDITDPIQKCEKARYREELVSFRESFTEAEKQKVDENGYYEQKRKELLVWNGYKNQLNSQLSKTEVLTNENFKMVFNLLDTTFELTDLKSGITWTSNPSKELIDSNNAIAKMQKSILNLTYINSDKSTTPIPATMSSFKNSSNDDKETGNKSNYYLKIDEENKMIIVYYVYTTGGIDYSSFPEKISGERMRELLKRSYDRAHEAVDNGNTLKDSDTIPKVICGFGENQLDLNRLATNSKDTTSVDGYFTGKDYYFANQLKGNVFRDIYRASDNIEEGKNPYDGYAEYYELYTKPEKLTKTNLKALYRFFYEWCGYTEEDLVIDSGAKVDNGQPELKAAIVYRLTDEGLKVTVPGNSIKGNSDANGNPYYVVSIDVLPYFTSSKQNTSKGYAVIPDGSGAIMEFDNQKSDYPAYSKRVYSSDLAFTSYTLTSETTDILLPMYGYIYSNGSKNNVGILTEITKGAPQATLNAYTSGQAGGANTFNYAYYSINFRESQQVIFGTSTYNRVNIKQYTQKPASGDYEICYDFLSTNDDNQVIDYSYLAKYYQQKLVDASNGRLVLNNDNTNQSILNLEIIGQYTFDDNFLGIKYVGKDTLTTIEQLDTILKEILDDNLTSSINVYYKGWRKEGLSNASFKNIKVSSKIGGRKELLDFINESKSNNITIYPEVEFLEYNKYQESFGNNHYTSRDIGGSYSIKQSYELNTGIYNKKSPKIMTLSPTYYYSFANTLAKNYSKVLKGVDTIALTGLGSQLSGSYRKNREVFKYTALEEQIKSLEKLEENGINKIALKAPYGFAIGYANNAYNVPEESSKQEILDYSIPFYQMIINGLFDYSGTSINEESEKGSMFHLMKCIETGSNPAFTFTYDTTSKLLQTDYNNYYYTYYQRWLSDVSNICKELNELYIYECNLVKHERIDNNVYKVVYQNKLDENKVIEIVLNYQRIPWVEQVDGTVVEVEANSYKIVKSYYKG